MPSPEHEQVQALTEAVVQLLRRVEQIEERLARLERLQAAPSQGVPTRATPPPVPPPLPVSTEPQPRIPQAPIPTPAPPVTPIPPAPAATRESAPPEGQHLETRMGLTWINRIGVLTLIIGVAFFFKYAIDNQWIGETGRVVLGILAGIATLAAGDMLWRRDQKIFAQGLCGLGTSILYLSFYATFGLYHLLPQAAAFILMVMVTAMAGALALRYDAMAIAALAMLGGYATPLLLSTGQDAPWTFFGYVLLINVGALAVARRRRWRPLEAFAFVATVFLYMLWFDAWFRPEKRVVATAAALAFYALFTVAESQWILYLAQAFAGIILAAIWTAALPYLALSVATGAAGLLIAMLRRNPMPAAISFATYWGAYGMWVAANGTPKPAGVVFAMLTLGFGIYLAWVVYETLVRKVEIRSQHLLVAALNGAIYFGCSYVLLKPDYQAWLGLFAAAMGGVHLLLGMRLWNERTREGYDVRPVLLMLGVALGFLTLAIPIQFTGYSITLSWAVEAAALTWIGEKTSEVRVRVAAIFVYLLVVARLLIFDAYLPAPHMVLVNSRFVTFTVSAASFWLGAWWSKSRREPAAAAYIAGHAILLIACLAEFNDWAKTTVSADNQGSVTAIGASILMALYAIALIAMGVAYRSALNRVLGLGLMGLVVAKLYLYDVWEASRLFRMGAFISLGILLLLVSFLYSRFRPAIESWWSDEKAGH